MRMLIKGWMKITAVDCKITKITIMILCLTREGFCASFYCSALSFKLTMQKVWNIRASVKCIVITCLINPFYNVGNSKYIIFVTMKILELVVSWCGGVCARAVMLGFVFDILPFSLKPSKSEVCKMVTVIAVVSVSLWYGAVQE